MRRREENANKLFLFYRCQKPKARLLSGWSDMGGVKVKE